jgi:geranylgeranyl diphosphate synthase type I
MRLPGILERYRTEVETELKAILNGRELPLYDMLRYHLGWTDDKGQPVESNSGKALRPALCLFACEVNGGDIQQALPAAGALELVHNFSLIHDDIQDGDRERRHRPTVWTIWGQPQAINAGTAMNILSTMALSRLSERHVSPARQLHVYQLLDDISLKLIEGQYLDIDFENRFDIGVPDYLTMIGGKTAALISGSLEIGAYLSIENTQIIEKFRNIGTNLGMAFQIRDDILGVWGDQLATGKTPGNDIRRRKKSFPVVYTLENINGSLRKDLLAIYQNDLIPPEAVDKVLLIFERTGVQAQAHQLVEFYCQKAWQIFQSLKLPPQANRDMEEVLQFLSARSY